MNKEHKVVFPVLNWNGTDGDVLMAHYIKTLDALHTLQGLMREGTPHGRDYQTAEPGTYEKAREQHSEMLNELSDIETRITSIAIGVQEQLIDRKSKGALKAPDAEPVATLV
jgi:hypothetical protein